MSAKSLDSADNGFYTEKLLLKFLNINLFCFMKKTFTFLTITTLSMFDWVKQCVVISVVFLTLCFSGLNKRYKVY